MSLQWVVNFFADEEFHFSVDVCRLISVVIAEGWSSCGSFLK